MKAQPSHLFSTASVLTLLLLSMSGCNSAAGKNEGTAAAGKMTTGLASAQQKAAQAYTEPPPPRFPKPEYVKGIYLTAWGAGGTKKMDKMMKLLDETELNAVVIDVRDAGEMYFKTGIELAEKSGANHIAVVDPKKMFDKLEKHKAYPIARIACFRDNFVPKKFPDLAVKFSDGRIWKDRAGYTWLDPYNKKNWDYIADTVEFALDLGFPEIQLDYVRFPSEGKMSSMHFPGKSSYKDPKALPQQVIAEFCHYIREKVKKRNAVFSADIFGIISSSKSDQGIGQSLEEIAEPFDLICPMVYPSHYARGEYGVANPDAQPYAILMKSFADYKKRLPNKPIRPWLQDFSLGHIYKVKEVHAQIKAAREFGIEEYLMWNASNRYTDEAYVGKVLTDKEIAASKAAKKK